MNKLKLVWPFVQARWLRRWKSIEKLRDYQEKELSKQYSYMRKHSPYYQKLAENAPFPQMDKSFMMTHFDELNTRGIDKETALSIALASEKNREFTQDYKGISVGLSSGTSGHRGMFITNEEEQALWAGTILGKMLPKGKLLGHKLAFFLRADNQLYQTINSRMIELSYFDMYLPLENHLARLNDYQPTILIAPASMLVALAKEIEQGTLQIQPQQVISVAEILEETDREYLKSSFDLSVIHQIYQCTEGFLGCTCEYGHLHLNEDLVLIEKEYIDEQRFYPIITDFKRTSQPIIKYRLNDILVESKEVCPCGSVFQRIEKIEGRSDDIFLFENESGETVSVFPDFIRRCLLFVSDIHEYQVSQLSKQSVEIAVDELTSEQKKQLLLEFQRLARDLCFIAPKITFVSYQWDQSTKLKRIARKFSEEVRSHEPY
ncbi:F390 synthetase-related protein [Enterococcus olivae]